MFRSNSLGQLAVVSFLGLTGAAPAVEQVPFHGTLDGSFISTPISGTPNALVVADGSGQATQLGHFSFHFPLTVNLATQTGGGIYTFTAADGDQVQFDVAARSSLLPNGLRRVEETGTVVGGTGRFAGATGGYVSERWLNRATGEMFGYFDGVISAPGAGDDSSVGGHGRQPTLRSRHAWANVPRAGRMSRHEFAGRQELSMSVRPVWR